MEEDIRRRTLLFAIQTIRACEGIRRTIAGDIVARQLIRSAASVGANAEEAVSALSRADFARKNCIALGEARETQYWLRIAKETQILEAHRADQLSEEARRIALILGAIVSTLRGTRKHSR